MKIRAAVLTSLGLRRPYATSLPLIVEDVILDPPGRDEVLISVKAASLCHSDLSVIEGNRPRPMPMVLGHEAAGVVEELGAGVSDLKVGDHVVAVFVPSCGICAPCQRGRAALCEPGAASNAAGTLINGARRVHSATGDDLNHHLGVSGFAQYAVVSRNSLVRVDRSLSFGQAAVFGCAVITGVGAVVNTADVEAESSVAVIGLGGVGLAALLGAKARGARPLIAVDLSEEKLMLAKELGADIVVQAAQPEAADAIREATSGGVDYAFEMAGSAKAMDLAYRITRRGGTTVTAGLPSASTLFSVPHVGIVAEERTIKGSYLGSCNPQRDIPRYIEWFLDGKLPVDRLLSSSMSLDHITEAFDRLADAATVRQIVVP
jgi:alcohol dehydrogenase